MLKKVCIFQVSTQLLLSLMKFLPSFMFPNSTVFFHTTLNSPTQLSAPCRATQEKCRSTSLKKFTRKCSKLARDAAQRLQNYPPFILPKCDGQNSHCALPRRFVPPFQCHCKFPYYQLVVVYVPTVTVAQPKNISSETCFLPKSLLEISNRGGGNGP